MRELRSAEDLSTVTEDKFSRGGEPFCLLYFEECDSVLFEDPARGFEWASWAPFVAGFVELADEHRRNELGVHSAAILSVAHRALGNFPEAEAAFQNALALSKRRGVSSSGKANVYRRLAGLRIEQRRFEEARELADRAVAIYRQENSLEGRQDLSRALTVRGAVDLNNGEYSSSLAWFSEALCYVDATANRRTLQSAIQNSAQALAMQALDGQTIGNAYRNIRQARRNLRDAHPSIPRAKLMWLEARLLAQIDTTRAEAGFIAARRDLIRFHAAYDVCLIALDLGAVYQASERWEDLRELAAETLELALGLEVAEEAIAALRLWSEAVEAQVATAVKERAAAARLALGQPCNHCRTDALSAKQQRSPRVGGLEA